jgi:hypothetical protein
MYVVVCWQYQLAVGQTWQISLSQLSLTAGVPVLSVLRAVAGCRKLSSCMLLLSAVRCAAAVPSTGVMRMLQQTWPT